MHSAIDEHVARAVYLDAVATSDALFGDEQFANMLLVGAACQSGALPVSAASIERAIELNGVAVATNVAAFGGARSRWPTRDALLAVLDSRSSHNEVEPSPDAAGGAVGGGSPIPWSAR